jgi:CheY-like chemotaxis protein
MSRESDARVATGYEGPRRKVLIVDDVAVNRSVITELLSRLGFDIIEAANGSEGLAKAQSERPALIVTDIVMPGMDGLEATRRMRQTPGLTDVPIIAVTASPSGSDEKKSLAAGVNAFLPKPVDFGLLLAQIRALLNLEWTYAARAHSPHSPQSSSPEVPATVPAPQMDELHRLARIGNMRDIIAWADQMSLIDPQYEPFTTYLRELAKGYQSKAILLLVERYIEARPAP